MEALKNSIMLHVRVPVLSDRMVSTMPNSCKSIPIIDSDMHPDLLRGHHCKPICAEHAMGAGRRRQVGEEETQGGLKQG